MKSFLYSVIVVFCLAIAGSIVATLAPLVGAFVGGVVLLVALFALFKPLPKLYLGHRLFSGSIAFFVGLLTLTASLGMTSNANRMTELKENAPEVYLAELKQRDETKWLSELRVMAPDQYESEITKLDSAEATRVANAAAAEAARAAEQEELAAERRAAANARREEQQAEQLQSYIEQLDREILAIPDVPVSNYTQDISSINTGLILIGTWGLLYDQGAPLPLDEDAQRKRQQFRQLLVRKQSQMLPAMRDAYGPVMRQELWIADGSARTIGSGFRTVEFVSASFARNANIQQIHGEVRENLMMLRFTRAQYKWIRQASEFSYYDMEVPRDTDIVKWDSGARYRVLE